MKVHQSPFFLGIIHILVLYLKKHASKAEVQGLGLAWSNCNDQVRSPIPVCLKTEAEVASKMLLLSASLINVLGKITDFEKLS